MINWASWWLFHNFYLASNIKRVKKRKHDLLPFQMGSVDNIIQRRVMQPALSYLCLLYLILLIVYMFEPFNADPAQPPAH